MGCAMYLLGNCVGFMSKTQGLLALSSGEAGLYAIGYGVMETIFLRNFLREVNPITEGDYYNFHGLRGRKVDGD